MARSKLALSSIALAFLFVGIWANAGIAAEIEVEQLRSKVETLENTILDKTLELKSKDERIKRLELILNEKSATISSLENENEFIQNKGSVDAEKLVGNARARAVELEKEVEKLRYDVEVLNRARDALEVRASHAEKRMAELILKLENLQKTNDEKSREIKILEHALQVAEEELLRSQIEATTKSIELTEAHVAWLPPWFETYLIHYQEIAAALWQEHAKPCMDILLHKASDTSAQVQKWLEPQFEAAKTKWVPIIKEQWMIIATNAEPYAKKMSTKTIEAYRASKTAIAPHIVKLQEMVDPYFQEAKKLSKPYIDQAATIAKPHVEKTQIILKPYTEYAVHAYEKFQEYAATYHHQVQTGFKAHLYKYELTKSLAIEELAWLMAFVLFGLPVFILCQFLLKIFCRKSKKVHRSSHASHGHRKTKRRHASK